MKKLFLSLCVITLCFTLVGCTSKANEKANIEFEGNPTTGYEWTCSSASDIVKLSYIYKSDSENVSGAGGKYTFTLEGVKEGETTLTCKYKRSWEATESDQSKEYNITVDKSLNVSYKEK